MSSKLLRATALAGTLALASACGDVIRAVKQTVAIGKALQRQIDRQSPNDEIRRHLRSLADGGHGDSVNALVQQGLPLLDSVTLVRRVELLHQMLTSAEEPLCAALARGNPSDAQMTLAMATLDSAALDDWMGMVVKSMVAAIQGPEAQAVGEDDVADALQQIVERLPGTEGERLMNTLGAIGDASDEEACWTGRVLYREILALGAPERLTLARGLVQQ